MACNWIRVLGLLAIFSFCHGADLPDVKRFVDAPEFQEAVAHMFPDQNNTRTGRITNGSPATSGQLPYQVYMYLYVQSGGAYLCGGSIIHERWILTAAHCLDGIVRIEVFLGAINRYTDGRPGSPVEFHIVTNRRSIIMHPGYNTNTNANDIALVELPRDAQTTHNYIATIRLPTGADLTRNLVTEVGTVSGFGQFSDSEASTSAVLNYITQRIVENEICSRTFGATKVTNSSICLPSPDARSACSGDSGGPLTVIGTNGQRILVGIVSFGAAAGCERGYPQVFARVSSHIPWIEGTTGLRFA